MHMSSYNPAPGAAMQNQATRHDDTNRSDAP